MTSVLDRPSRVNPATNLKCRHCGATYELAAIHVCERCFAPLEIGYDEDLLARVTRESIEAGPYNLWRYVGLLPAGHDPATRVSLGAGWTPL
ncbi:MAG: threonine synthase, partial [Frankiaceae bacterium]|nr:threonine synthase [Frankiaceae bacterium]